jgi:hypothetical protein
MHFSAGFGHKNIKSTEIRRKSNKKLQMLLENFHVLVHNIISIPKEGRRKLPKMALLMLILSKTTYME